MPMKYVCAHKAYSVVSVCLISDNEVQKTLDNIILLLVSVCTLIMPYSYLVECAQSQPDSPGQYLLLLSCWCLGEKGRR